MFDLTPSQVLGLYLLLPCITGLAYLIGVGRTKVVLHRQCVLVMDAMAEAHADEVDRLEAPPYHSDHTNCTICKHRREARSEAERRYAELEVPHLVRGN